MNLQVCYNASEDLFPLPSQLREIYGSFGFPAPRDSHRPYVSSNFVVGLDGRTSFRELKGLEGGRTVSRSKEDRWLMDFLRAHHDGLLIGAKTLREERGPHGVGWDFGVNDAELQKYRQETLKLGKLKVIVLTGSGNLDLKYQLFRSTRVEPWILTGGTGEKRLRVQLERLDGERAIQIVRVGGSERVNLEVAIRLLRQSFGIRTLLCEGGPEVYGQLLGKNLVDEEFRTISFQVLGESSREKIPRPTPYGSASYAPQNAPWFRLISLHYALPYHAFFRFRYEGPRKFED